MASQGAQLLLILFTVFLIMGAAAMYWLILQRAEEKELRQIPPPYQPNPKD